MWMSETKRDTAFKPYLTLCNRSFAIGLTANYLVIDSHPIAIPTKVANLHGSDALEVANFQEKMLKIHLSIE